MAFGAFGAHALQGTLPARAQGWYATAVDYQGLHALALVLCGVLGLVREPARALSFAAPALLAGTLVFSGTLYLMAFTGLTWLGAVTPIGGVLLILGWSALALAGWRTR